HFLFYREPPARTGIHRGVSRTSSARPHQPRGRLMTGRARTPPLSQSVTGLGRTMDAATASTTAAITRNYMSLRPPVSFAISAPELPPGGAPMFAPDPPDHLEPQVVAQIAEGGANIGAPPEIGRA